MFEPVTAAPNFAEQEEAILAFWQERQIFQKSMRQNEGKKPFIIYDGPPYANAKPPLHTAVPMSFKDLVGRYKTMRGHFVPRQVGWDTHGLPIEVQIEKKLGLSSKKDILNLVPGDSTASIQKFNEICRQSVWEFKQEWDKFVPRVGYWTDTEHPYVTYDSDYMERSWSVFKQIWEKDVVYKGYKVVPFCPRCGTPLSTHEVAQEYKDVKDVSVFVSFPLVNQPNRAILAWTTTPWTLPGNVALAVGNEIDYVVVRQENEKEYVLAKSRLSILKGDYVIVEELKGEALLGLSYIPLYPEVLAGVEKKKHLVVSADFVTTEDGTGVVHTAGMYGEDDFNLCRDLDLPLVHSVGKDGIFLDNVDEFKGMYIRDALVPILKSLTAKERLYGKETITHSYPFCWRCKTALVYYATDSWFVAMSKLRTELVANNNKVAWIPEHMQQGRFGEFIKEARDWAISRERFWGIPMPIWISESGKQICIGSFAELKSLAKNPELVGENFDPHRPFVDEIILVKDGEEYLREPVVLDIWFDSGSMPYASGFEDKGYFPADFIAEATDQTRGWFYTLHAIGTIIRGQAPFKRVVCMGLLLDENGKKMSKSVGNIQDPWEIFSLHGVDAFRWFIYSVNSPGEPKLFGLKELQGVFRKTILLTWNVFNYFVTYANVAEFKAPTEAERVEMRNNLGTLPVMDQWILSRQASVQAEVTKFLDDYDFMRATRTLEAYIDELSTWYLRRSRKRSDAEFFITLFDVLLNLATMLAPFMPFLSERLYQVLHTEDMPESVHLQVWPEVLQGQNLKLENQMRVLRQAVEFGQAVRAAEKMKVRQPLQSAHVYLSSGEFFAPDLQTILADELNVLEVIRASNPELEVPAKGNEAMTIGLNVRMTDSLRAAGKAREFLRHIQQLRKNSGLQPGQMATLIVGPSHKSIVEDLLSAYPSVLQDAYLQIDPEQTWHEMGEQEIILDDETILVSLRP